MLFLLFVACSYTPIAIAGDIAIVVHIDNKNAQITKSEVINIFMGRFRQYQNGEKAKPYDNLSIKDAFYRRLINKSPSDIKAYWARLIFSGRTLPPKRLNDTSKIIERIMVDKQGISYMPLSQADDSVKILLILKEEQ